MKKHKIRQQNSLSNKILEPQSQQQSLQQLQQQQTQAHTSKNSVTAAVNQTPKAAATSSTSNTIGVNSMISSQMVNSGQSINCNQLRAGDWVCLLCNNLNFSFRNECNRCLVQTKKKNFFQNMMLVQETQEITPNSQSDQQQSSSTQHQATLPTNIREFDLPQTPNGSDPLEFDKYSKGKNCRGGFENMLLLLTPNRSIIHSDDEGDHRVSATTTAPLSSHSNSDPEQGNDAKKLMQQTPGNCNKGLVFKEDRLFGNSNIVPTQSTVVALSFSSPEETKNKKKMKESKQDFEKQSCSLKQRQGEFLLFGQTTEQPHFMSSPGSMQENEEQLIEKPEFRDDDSDSGGSYQQEIQQQINNIIMDEEENCLNINTDITFKNADDKPSFSFGGNFGFMTPQKKNELSLDCGFGQQSFSQANQGFNSNNQIQGFNQAGNSQGYQQGIIYQQQNQSQYLQSNNSNAQQMSQGASQNGQPCGGLNFLNYSQYINSNTFNNQPQHQSSQQSFLGSQQGLKGAVSMFQGSSQSFQNTSIFQGSQPLNQPQSSVLQNKNDSNQSSMSSSQSKNGIKGQEENCSNTQAPVRTGGILGKLAQLDHFHQQEDLINQNTINFQQASSFVGNHKLTEEISEEEGVSGEDEEMINLNENDEGKNSAIKSAKKSNNIRKKRKNLTQEHKKKNKSTVSHNTHLPQNANSLQESPIFNFTNIPPTCLSQPVPESSFSSVKETCQFSAALNQQTNQVQSVKKQDWICPRCANLNYSFRKLCNKCQFAKNNFAIHVPPNFVISQNDCLPSIF